mmetsp:Transcript_3477/g.4929  ORF Transcript_3477/g.4929 Transcript_3477/m.4929 type:complete len:738 (-) Transcript_3477:62-2275(-)|eukprot:CAMPEP_0194073180 /NCGR_PEP_ID=MMETSP0149-20130528/695_1 /TAXON_ID=122233 /ORGANISM="Chaetoceros debilis, Strain MM31A-1" /LENGTH=737 /DNA_ID=CAMNT_0038753155 /DNA_START=214 /DNA_END=2427 /DNA_ORIENTATION=-
MTQSFNATMREELDYVGTESAGEALDFAALGTFDNSDDVASTQAIAASGMILPHLSHGNESNFNDAGGNGSCTQMNQYSDIPFRSTDRNQKVRGQSSASPGMRLPQQMNSSPLSSVSKDDSSSDGTTYVRNTSSIFRPRQSKGNEEYRRPEKFQSSRQTSFEQYKRPMTPIEESSSERQNNLGYNYYQHHGKEVSRRNIVPSYGATRQVSVCDNRNALPSASFDSFGSARYSQNIAHIDSFMDGNRAERGQYRSIHQRSIDEEDSRHPGNTCDERQPNAPVFKQKNISVRDIGNDGHTNISPTSSYIVTPKKQGYNDIESNYVVLRSKAKMFTEFSFILPGLKMYVMKAANEHHDGWNNSFRASAYLREELIAKRRLTSAILAYGGVRRRSQDVQVLSAPSGKDTMAANAQYEQSLAMRYYESNSRLSWDVEETPPIEIGDGISSGKGKRTSLKDSKSSEVDYMSKTQFATGYHEEDDTKNGIAQNQNSNISIEQSHTKLSDTPKMKYRCKLCGQPKQNHTCPYQQELQRSIGTMAYPALNAYQCKEPGYVAPSLSSMNNFTDLEEEETEGPSNESMDNVITPEAVNKQKRHFAEIYSSSVGVGLTGKKRKMSSNVGEESYKGNDNLILPQMEIKPEQIRAVSVSSSANLGNFNYAPLPLTFTQRKDMSDKLFELCQEVTGLTDECAEVLQAARETDMWDLAIAELIAQILVILYCPPNDMALEGLRTYFLTIGISC